MLDYTRYMQSLDLNTLGPVLQSLNEKLLQMKEIRELIVCGGGALLVLGIIERQTRDIDVISPEIDPLLQELAAQIGKEFGLEKGWLNNGPASLVRDLERGWAERVRPIFHGSALTVKTLSVRDLLATKLYAYCDRDEDDLSDILRMNPSPAEVESLRAWVLDRDGSAYWPDRVQKCFTKLLARLGHGH